MGCLGDALRKKLAPSILPPSFAKDALEGEDTLLSSFCFVKRATVFLPVAMTFSILSMVTPSVTKQAPRSCDVCRA